MGLHLKRQAETSKRIRRQTAADRRRFCEFCHIARNMSLFRTKQPLCNKRACKICHKPVTKSATGLWQNVHAEFRHISRFIAHGNNSSKIQRSWRSFHRPSANVTRWEYFSPTSHHSSSYPSPARILLSSSPEYYTIPFASTIPGRSPSDSMAIKQIFSFTVANLSIPNACPIDEILVKLLPYKFQLMKCLLRLEYK